MDIYKNPNCKKVRGSHLLEISCARCGCYIAGYRKVGESNLVKLYHERITESAMDLTEPVGALFCPSCGEKIATGYTVKADKKAAYRLVPSAFRKKRA